MLELSPWYDGREQSYVKHYLLEQYLARFARIIGFTWRTITYIDSFAGPWESRHPEYRDTSFGIAVNSLREARQWFAQQHGRDLQIRCLFLETDKKRFEKLKAYADSLADVEAKALNEEFEKAVPDILNFVNAGSDTFTFLFVDPTGWTGFALDVIRPLLQTKPNEILINFMTGHIRRFLETENSVESFVRLFGRDIRDRLTGLEGDAREEKAVGEYMRSVKNAGDFLYVGSAIVFKPEIETPHFHLVYATRHNKGVKAFKEVEQRLAEVESDVRAAAHERRSLQTSFLSAREMHPSPVIADRRKRYLQMAKSKVRAKLEQSRSVTYAVLWRMALAYPLVWEQDIRGWIDEWKTACQVRIPTMTGRRQKPDPNRDEVEWIG
jgi:three-Cys-motif partner protein